MIESRTTSPGFGLLLLLSLLIHLAILYWFAPGLLRPVESPAPIPVTLLPNEPALARQIEPVPPPIEEVPPTEPAKRLGPTDQNVAQESAPEADDVIDSQPRTVRRKPAEPTPSPPKVITPPKTPPAEAAPSQQATAPPPTDDSPSAPEAPATTTLDDLTRLPESTTARLQQKKRELPAGDQLQLNMREDVLNSFFLRFKRHVMGAWNYPQISRQRLEQGEVLTRLTVNRQGKLLDLELVNGSGYGALDDAAIEAVKRSSPYGPYSSFFPDDTLTFDVLFVYRIRGLGRELYRR